MGHVNNAVIMEFFDLGKSYYFSASGIPVEPAEGDFTVMVVHVEVDFKSQIHYHDSVEVQSSVTRWGNKSFDLLQRVVERSSGRVCAECRTVMSGYIRSLSQSAPIPDDIKHRVDAFDNAHNGRLC